MTWGLVAVAGASLVGGMMSSNAASSAADKQQQASQQTLDLQKQMFDTQNGYQQPYRDAGGAAMQRLSYLLGTGQGGYSGPVQGVGAPTTTTTQSPYGVEHSGEDGGFTPFGPQTTTTTTPAKGANPADIVAQDYNTILGRAPEANGAQYWQDQLSSGRMTPEQVSQAIAASPEGQQSGNQAGSLTRNFNMSDFQADPGVQFQTQQGNLALTNSAAAQNGVMSGAALKDFIGYNQGMAGTAYQSAYERYMNNNASTYQKLMGMTGVGQAAASNSSSNAAAASGAMSNTITGSANAAASGIVGSANAMAGGISGAGNSYFLSSLLNKNGTSTSKAPGVVADDLSTADRTIG